jgi:hypothetical protein
MELMGRMTMVDGWPALSLIDKFTIYPYYHSIKEKLSQVGILLGKICLVAFVTLATLALAFLGVVLAIPLLSQTGIIFAGGVALMGGSIGLGVSGIASPFLRIDEVHGVAEKCKMYGLTDHNQMDCKVYIVSSISASTTALVSGVFAIPGLGLSALVALFSFFKVLQELKR